MTAFLANKQLNKQEIRDRATVLSSRFTSLICTLENRCNIQCIMCGVWRQPWSLPERVFREIMDALPYLEHAIWLGGEVFLSPYFSAILQETRKYPYIEQRVNTNALLIDDQWAELLVQNNLELICSIDGATPKTYEHIRRGGKFPDLLKAMEAIRRARERAGAERFTIRMNTVVMRSNYRELELILDLAREYGFANMQLIGIQGEDSPEHIFTDTPDNRVVTHELRGIVERLEAKARSYGIDLLNCLPMHAFASPAAGPCAPSPEMPLQDKVEPVPRSQELSCYLPWQQVLIEPQGLVKPGCWCPTPIGNIETGSLADAWNSPVAQNYRRRIAEGAFATCCDKKCVEGEIPGQLRMVNEFEKKHARYL